MRSKTREVVSARYLLPDQNSKRILFAATRPLYSDYDVTIMGLGEPKYPYRSPKP